MTSKSRYIARFAVSGNDIVNGSVTFSDLGTVYTANIIESGNTSSGNVYFSNTRAIGALVSGSGISIDANGLITSTALGGVQSVNDATGNVTLTTANIAESGNLYFTNARVYANVIELGYATTSQLNTKANVVDLTTSNVTEGTNLYYTNARVYAAVTGNLALKANVTDLTTSNVTEGSNLYFTNARSRAAISVTGSGTYDEANGIISITGGGGSGSANIIIYGEGSILTNSVSSINFVGTGISTSVSGSNVTVTVSTSDVTSSNVIYQEDTFTGNGSSNTFNLTSNASQTDSIVVIDGLVQFYTTDYTLSGNTLLFTSPPADGETIKVLRLQSGGGTSTIEDWGQLDGSVLSSDDYGSIV